MHPKTWIYIWMSSKKKNQAMPQKLYDFEQKKKCNDFNTYVFEIVVL